MVFCLRLVAVSLATFCCSVAQGESAPRHLNTIYSTRHITLENNTCNWPICNFNNTEQTVVIPEGFTLPSFVGLEIYMARAVHIYPACVHEIRIVGTGFATTFPGKDTGNSHQSNCAFFLELKNSRAEIISYGVEKLVLNHSTVDTLQLTHQKGFTSSSSNITTVEKLHWDSHRSNILDTSISEVIQIRADSDWSISMSTFDLIHMNGIIFNGTHMNLTESSVEHVKSHGITIASGTALFSHVYIGELEAFAIVVENPEAFVEFSNVTIGSAAAESIVLLDRERVSLKNVTVEGMELNYSSPYLKFEDDFIPRDNVSNLFVQRDLPQCSSTNSTLSCDFDSVDQIIEVDSSHLNGFQVLQIKNAKYLLVHSNGCNVELQLKSVNGSLPHLTTGTNLSSFDGEVNDPCGMTLSVVDSKLDVILGRFVSNLTVVNSSVSRLHGGIIESLVMQNVKLELMDNIYLNGGPFVWTEVEIDHLFNLSIQSPIQANKLNITSTLVESAVTVDHDNATSEFVDLNVFGMNQRSLMVKSGKFILKKTTAFFMRADAIYLEEGATLEINTVYTIIPTIKIISVDKLTQVTLNGENNSTSQMIHIRRPSLNRDMDSNFTISSLHLSPYCHWDFLKPLNCDFSKVENATLIVDLDYNQKSEIAYVRGASFVTIYPSCIEKLNLLEVAKATTVESEKDCSTWLQAEGVQFYNITTGVTDVTLKSCSVDLLSPDQMLRDLDLENTHVEKIASVHWSDFTGMIMSSHLVRVDGLIASSDMQMFNTTIEKILPPGITLKSGAIIRNSTINAIASGGITVEGKLLMEDIFIGTLARNAIKVKKEGTLKNIIIGDIAPGGIVVEGLLHMKDVVINTLAERAITVKGGILILSNVRINSSREDGIVSEQNGAIGMQSVTIGGKKLQTGHYKEGTKKSESIPLSAGECISWKWGFGLLTGALLFCIIVLLSKSFRLRTAAMVHRVSWKGNEEQNDVLIENQEDTSSPRHSGYHPVRDTT